MAYYLVAPGIDLSLELYLSPEVERAVALQWERLTDSEARESFTRRVEKQLETVLPEAIDWDIKEPSPAQLSYAMAVSKELNVPIPPDALRYRGIMHEFLEQHVPKAKEKWQRKQASD